MTETIAILFYSSFAIQFVFIALSVFALMKKRINIQKTHQKSISVVIAAHNEYDSLKSLIPALLNQSYTNFEVIISLDRCTDLSEELILRYEDERLRHCIIKNDEPGGKKIALMNGVAKAKNELIVFTDADCIPNSNAWLNEIDQQLSENKEIGLGFSPYRTKAGFLNLFIRYDTLVTAFQYLSFALLGRPYMGVGRNLVVKKTLFQEVNGYDGYMHLESGDDDLFVNKNANRNNVVPILGGNSLIMSEPKTSFGEFIKQKQRHLSVGKYYRKVDQILLGLIGLSQIMFWLTFIILAAIQANLSFILMAVGIRWLFLVVGFRRTTKLLGNQFAYWFVPLLDFVYSIYLLTMAPVGFFTRKVRWK
jgi:glycosyltransferase involved in cell wall biosynthesis